MPTRSKARNEEPAEAGSDVVMDEAPTSHQPESKDDEMSVDQEGNDEAEEAEEDEYDEEEGTQRIRLVCHRFPELREVASALMATISHSSLARHRLLPRLSFLTRVTLSEMPCDISSTGSKYLVFSIWFSFRLGGRLLT